MTAQLSRYNFRNGVPTQGVMSPFFVLKYKKTGAETLGVAVIVSKKIDKRATRRNTIKRQILNILRELLHDSPGIDIVIYARKPISTCSYPDIFQAFQQMLKKEGII